MVTVAVIGCGRIANNAHLPVLTKMENVRVKYACDLIEKKAQAAKEKWGNIENVITDYKIALSDPEVDAVYVLTPNFAHYTVTMDAIKAGKHVFCEKPITVNYKLSCEMAKAAKKAGVICNIGVCNRYHSSVEKIAEMIKEGKLGKVYHVYCSFRSCRSIPGLGGAFTTKSMSGGGALIDWGVHFIDLILYVLGDVKVKTMSADTYSEMAKDMSCYKYVSMWAEDTKDLNGTNDVDDFVTGYVRTTGASISLNGAWAQNIDRNDMFIEFLGDKGGIRLEYGSDFEFFDGEKLVAEQEEMKEGQILAENKGTLAKTHYNFDGTNMYAKEDDAFIKATQSGEITRSNIENVLQSARVLDGLYESASKHKEIKA